MAGHSHERASLLNNVQKVDFPCRSYLSNREHGTSQELVSNHCAHFNSTVSQLNVVLFYETQCSELRIREVSFKGLQEQSLRLLATFVSPMLLAAEGDAAWGS